MQKMNIPLLIGGIVIFILAIWRLVYVFRIDKILKATKSTNVISYYNSLTNTQLYIHTFPLPLLTKFEDPEINLFKKKVNIITSIFWIVFVLVLIFT